MNPSAPLTGGNSNQVFKQGQTVLRQTGAWSPFVHALLRHLTAHGFTESPILLEATPTHERLTFIEGDVGNYPLLAAMQTDGMVIEAAQLLRRFHDLTAHFVIPPDAQLMLPAQSAHEVICHNDFAPYNLVFQGEHIVGIIDFDAAAPGSRLWDIAYAVYRFAPLVTDAHCWAMGWSHIPDRQARLNLFCDAYGLENRAPLIETVIRRIEALVNYMRDTSSNLDHIPTYLADLEYLRATFLRQS